MARSQLGFSWIQEREEWRFHPQPVHEGILAGENVIFRGKTSFQGLMASLMKPDVKNPPSGKS